jgi:site-specific DNA-methyltransferase (adenine-specific)
MKPYYDEAGITIYHADCRDVLPALSEIDLLVTDPPFFMPVTHYSSRTPWAKSWGDVAMLGAAFGAVLELSVASLALTANVASFCDGASFAAFYPEFYRRFPQVRTLVWDKCHFGMGHQWRKQHELIIVGRTSADAKWTGGHGLPDILRAKTVNSAARRHPVDKPVDLLRQLVGATTDRGDLVVDPYMGGGSALAAAAEMERRAIGIEIEERYCEIAARRLAQEVLDFGGAA